MRIKLASAESDSHVVFTLSFANLPFNLQIPPGWANQIAVLNMDDLELPNVLHALDKSTCAAALLHEVAFDMPSETISCLFVDGSTEEWSFAGNAALFKALWSVVQYVDAASAETERERERKVAKQRWKEYQQQRLLTMAIPAPVTLKTSRHRKQRSLLMTLVASFVPSVRSAPPPPPPPLPPPSPPPHLTSASFRTKARTTLTDAFRRYVVTELGRRSLPGDYYTWVIKSMLRRISDNLDDLVLESRGALPPHSSPMQSAFDTVDYLPGLALPPPSPSPSPSPPPSSIGDESMESDTDGSSLHTPSTSSSFTPNTSNASFTSRLPPPGLQPESDAERSTGKEDECVMSSETLATYKALSENAVRLRNLLVLAVAKAGHEEQEARAREAMLEVRCRRRAWLSKKLTACGMAGVELGMSAPFERSPLGLRGWTAADLEDEDEDEDRGRHRRGEAVQVKSSSWNDRSELGGRGSLRQRLGLCDSRLFPVSEEVEEEDEFAGEEEGVFVEREMSLDMDFELELGNDWVRSEDADPTPQDLVLLERPKARPRRRIRTNSMHLRRRHLETVDFPLSMSLSPTSLLYSPLKGYRGISPDPDVDGIPFFDRDEEFTLSMDLPRRRSMRGGDGYGREDARMPPSLGVAVN